MHNTPSLAAARRAVSITFLVNGIVLATWAARIPAVREQLALRESALGFALLAMAAGALLAFRAAGPLIARFGSRRITRVASVLLCATLPLPGLAPSYALLVTGLLLVGAANGLLDVAMNAQGVEVERLVGRPILSAFHGMFSLGGLVGASAGALAAMAELSPAVHFLLAAGITLVPAAVVGRVFVADAPVTSAADTSGEKRSILIILLGIIGFCGAVGEGAMADWSAVYLRDDLRTSASVAAIGFAVFSLTMLIGRFSGDLLTQRFGAVRIVRAAGLVVTGGLGAALLVNAPVAMMVGFACVGAGLSVVVPLVFRAGANVPGVSPGRGLATIATMTYGGFLAGPPVIGFVADRFTLRFGLGLVVALALVVVLLARVLEPRAERSMPLPTVP